MSDEFKDFRVSAFSTEVSKSWRANNVEFRPETFFRKHRSTAARKYMLTAEIQGSAEI